MNLLADVIVNYWQQTSSLKHTPNGWQSGNAVCCEHRGTSQDRRRRGGIKLESDGSVIYHCFNCGYSAGWQPGSVINHRMIKLLEWLGVPDDEVDFLRLNVLKITTKNIHHVHKTISFETKSLPNGAKLIKDIDPIIPNLTKVLEYMHIRGLFLDDYDFYWSPDTLWSNRLIIPYYHNKKIVGFTARSIVDCNAKYLTTKSPGYVFNIDQKPSRKIAIVCEGVIDAILMDCCAVMSNTMSNEQVELLTKLNRQLVVVPDRDSAGEQLVKQAINLNWSVSFPDWPIGVKDINDAVLKLGRLSTLYSIVEGISTNPIKTKIYSRSWFKHAKQES